MHDFIKERGSMARAIGTLVIAAAMLVRLAGIAGAQQPASATPWRAWLGCWSAASATPASLETAAPLVCVTPAGNPDAVTITTLAAGKVISSQTVDASGRALPLEAKGCTGTQTGRWSADGRRVYLNAVATCDGTARTTSGIVAMTADGDWIDVQGMKAGSVENVRVARYHDAGITAAVPANIADQLRDGGLAISTARMVAGADIGTTAVVEAAGVTGVGVAEAFVLERGQRFALNAQQLLALADAGVSTRLTDAMIAVSNPQVFAVKRDGGATQDTNEVTGRRIFLTLDRYSPWGWGYSSYMSRYGDCYSPYASTLYRYGCSNAYGPGYGYGYPGYSYGGPVIIVRGTEPPAPHGRLVKGHGYQPAGTTQNGNTPDRTAQREAPAPRPSTAGSSSSPAPASSPSSSERTAKPRP